MPAPPAPVTSATRPAKRSDVRFVRQAEAAGWVLTLCTLAPTVRGTVRLEGMIAVGHHFTVIDAHHHFVVPDRVSYPDLERAMPEINRRLVPADLAPQLRAAQVDGTVLVQAANETAETALMLELAAAVPWVLGVVGWMPLETRDAAAAALVEIADDPKLVGIRY